MYNVLELGARVGWTAATLGELIGQRVKIRLFALQEYWRECPTGQRRYNEIKEAISTGLYTDEALVKKVFEESGSLLVEFPSGFRAVIMASVLKVEKI